MLFADALNGVLDAGISIFVELGPHPILLHAVEQTAHARGAQATTVGCGRREEGESAALLSPWGGFGRPASNRLGSRSAWGRSFGLAAALSVAA